MSQVVTANDIRRLGTILGVWAHPDDESFVAAGLLATAARNGQTVVCVTATKGEAGVQDAKRWPPETLGEVRAAELAAACAVLGLKEHSWLGYPDGGCQTADRDEAVAQVRELVKRWQPDSVVTFGPDGLTGHPDHQSVSRWATEAVRTSGSEARIFHAVHTPEQYEDYLKGLDEKLNIFFNIKKPPLVAEEKCAIAYKMTPEVSALKRRAMAVMPSQMEVLCELLPQEKFDAVFAVEYFVELDPKSQ